MNNILAGDIIRGMETMADIGDIMPMVGLTPKEIWIEFESMGVLALTGCWNFRCGKSAWCATYIDRPAGPPTDFRIEHSGGDGCPGFVEVER